MKNTKTNKIKRREFLRQTGLAAAAIGFPAIIPSSALGNANTVPPSERITLGCIGAGSMGGIDLNSFLKEKDCQVLAVCDVDRNHAETRRDRVNRKYGNQDCALYQDFRELISRPDIDTVMIATPDHWHALIAIAAANAGKDIYGEKPLSHTFRQGQAIRQAVNDNGRIWQTGSFQRSMRDFRFACELVRNGRLGKVKTVHIGMKAGIHDTSGVGDQKTFCQPPNILDYDLWLGPAPWAPYCPARVHKNWRWNLDYGGGQLMDWIGHHADIAHWGMDLDNTGPLEIEAHGRFAPRGNLWNAMEEYVVFAKYPGDIQITINGGWFNWGFSGIKWIGPDGWVWVDRDGIDAHPKSLLTETFGPHEIHLFRSPGHRRNFLDCVKTRNKTITPAEVAHRSATPGHLGLISMLLGRKLRFDPDKEEILNDESASRLLACPMRSPWRLE